MLHPFVSGRPSTRRGARGAAVSIVIHVALIVAFVAASGSAAHTSEAFGSAEERVVRLTLPPPTSAALDAREEARATAVLRAARPSRLARLLKFASSIQPIEVTTPLATLAPSTEVDAGLESMDGLALGGDGAGDALLGAIVGKAYARPVANGAYEADVVERQVWPRRGNPIPVYPPPLVRQGLEASYFVSFIVDSTGRVDRTSLTMPPDAHSLFVNAIRAALSRSRYFPAEIGGKPVAQRVMQEFKFALAR
jgi:hypothetical protein